VASVATDRYRSPALSPDARAALLDWLAGGGTVSSYCRQPQAPTMGQIRQAIAADPQLAADMRAARAEGADVVAEECERRADTPSDHPDDVAHRRLRIDTRRWLAKAWAPATYGDASRVTHAGDAAAPVVVTDAERAAKIAAILASAQQQQPGKASDGASDAG
jgi:hypothetical protein